MIPTVDWSNKNDFQKLKTSMHDLILKIPRRIAREAKTRYIASYPQGCG